LGQSEKSWHQWVTLLAAFPLQYGVRDTRIVCPEEA
jgi:hypothetical protein